MRLTLGDRSEQLSIGLISHGVKAGEVIGHTALTKKYRQELSEALPIAFARELPPCGNAYIMDPTVVALATRWS